MITINFLQFGTDESYEPEDIATDLYTTQSELTGEMLGDMEWEVKAILKENIDPKVALKDLQEHYDFEVFSIMEDGKVVMTEEDL